MEATPVLRLISKILFEESAQAPSQEILNSRVAASIYSFVPLW
jgi:hypothetical protein